MSEEPGLMSAVKIRQEYKIIKKDYSSKVIDADPIPNPIPNPKSISNLNNSNVNHHTVFRSSSAPYLPLKANLHQSNLSCDFKGLEKDPKNLNQSYSRTVSTVTPKKIKEIFKESFQGNLKEIINDSHDFGEHDVLDDQSLLQYPDIINQVRV
jgi:hypothetical protein